MAEKKVVKKELPLEAHKDNPYTTSGAGYHVFQLLTAKEMTKGEVVAFLKKKAQAGEIKTKDPEAIFDILISTTEQKKRGFRIAAKGDKFRIIKTGLEPGSNEGFEKEEPTPAENKPTDEVKKGGKKKAVKATKK